MSHVKLAVLELSVEDEKLLPPLWELPLGSKPRKAGERVEHLIVPEGKLWLFPIGNAFMRLENALPKSIRVERKEFLVKMQ